MQTERQITAEGLADFARALRREERAAGTEENYLRHVRAFAAWLDGVRRQKRRRAPGKSTWSPGATAPTRSTRCWAG